MTSIQSPDNNGSVVDGSTMFHEPRVDGVKTMMGSKITPTSVTDQVANNQQSKSNNTLTEGATMSTTGHSKYDPSRKRCSISVHSQHNHPGGGGGSSSNSNGDAIRPGGGGFRELSPQSLRIHRKSSHDIRILGADGEMLMVHEGTGKMPTVVKPIKLKSITTKAESYDTLHGRATDVSIYQLANLCLCIPVCNPHSSMEGDGMAFDKYSATKARTIFTQECDFSNAFR